MTITNVSLTAVNAYSNSNDSINISNIKQSNFSNSVSEVTKSISNANSFQSLARSNFNSFANMTTAQILSHVQSHHKASVDGVNSSGVMESVARAISNDTKKHERTVRASLVNDASLSELLATTNEAITTVQIMTKLQREVITAYQSVMSMQI